MIAAANSILHHLLFPQSRWFFVQDLGFNAGSILLYNTVMGLPSSAAAIVRPLSLLTASGYAAGQFNGGCATQTGLWTHILLCQAPGAFGSVFALTAAGARWPSVGEWCMAYAWAFAVVERLLLPRTIHDRARVAWAVVCSAIGCISVVEGMLGYCNKEGHVTRLVSLRGAHELGSLVIEVAQRKATNMAFIAHHVVVVLCCFCHRSDWYDANTQAYRLPDGARDVLYTEKDAAYWLGCSELSSVFLQCITAASDRGWARGGLVAHSLVWSKPLFALTYIVVRVLWWPVHTWPVAYRLLSGVRTKYLIVPRLFGFGIALLSALQLKWAHKIVHMAMAAHSAC